MATQNHTTGFRPDYQDRWARQSAQLQKRRNATYDSNMAVVNAEVQRLLQQRRV